MQRRSSKHVSLSICARWSGACRPIEQLACQRHDCSIAAKCDPTISCRDIKSALRTSKCHGGLLSAREGPVNRQRTRNQLDHLETRYAIVQGLRAAITAHRANRLFDIGEGWDDAASLARDDDRLSLALSFWEGWADSAEHQWLYYEGMCADDWPRLAEVLIDSLEHNREIVDPKLVEFGKRHPPSTGLIAWLKSLFT